MVQFQEWSLQFNLFHAHYIVDIFIFAWTSFPFYNKIIDEQFAKQEHFTVAMEKINCVQ